MTKQICLNKQQSMLLDKFLGKKDNHQLFDFKSHVEIAAIAAGDLEFPISPSTVTMTWKAMILNGEEVWEAPIRKTKLSFTDEIAGLKKQNAEQETLITRLYARVIEIEKYMEEEKEYTVLAEEFDRKQGGGNGTALAV